MRVARILNPYAGINFATCPQVKANFHTHSTKSDGVGHPHQVIDKYLAEGYGVLAITDHDNIGGHPYDSTMIAYPWSSLSEKNALWQNRNPENMIAVPGCECSYPRHTLSLFCEYPGHFEHSPTVIIEAIGAAGGLGAFAHPYSDGAISAFDYCLPHYRSYPHMVGFEVFNGVDEFERPSRGLDVVSWDQLLTALAPNRLVWGHGSDDAHSLTAHVGRAYTLMLLPVMSLAETKAAYQFGRTFFVTRTVASQAVPTITNITDNGSTLTISASGYETVEWVNNGVVVGDGLELNYTGMARGYVRCKLKTAVVSDQYAEIYTQPFGIITAEKRGTVLI